ncbi:MAG: hypothetical protein AAGA93_03660 [Actinomycetota bacterium]
MATTEPNDRGEPVAVELIAHRAGNHAGGVDEVSGRADTVELDVRIDRRRLVVRHARRLWFTDRLWEKWYLLPPQTPVLAFADAAAAVDDDLGLWVDCKGIGPRIPRRALAEIGSRSGLTVSSKAWWMLGSVPTAWPDGRPVRVVRSVSNRFELFLLRFLPSRVQIDGVVAHSRLLEGRLVQGLRERYGTVFSWSIPDAATGRLLASWGVQGLIIDDPEVMDELRQIW